MTDEINIKIMCDTSQIVSATEAMKELAAATDKVREALDKLFGTHDTIVTGIEVSKSLLDEADEIKRHVRKTMEAIDGGIRPAGKTFSL
ncbi:hypothetical protein [Rhizobium sp. RCAM05973]|uniref:hypothetical protein n=1 Tax=Rhizobium sp. RCAM05973 TaxID=2994066 RepID=UPI0022EC0922|nr:hypothetical protein [Rhizobium sp. RCAM05973]